MNEGEALKLVLERMMEITGTADLPKFPEVFSLGGKIGAEIGFFAAGRKIAAVAKDGLVSNSAFRSIHYVRSRGFPSSRYVQTAGADPNAIDRRIYDGVR